MRMQGAVRSTLNNKGELAFETDLGVLRASAPEACQAKKGRKKPVHIAWVLSGNEYGFKVGDYDRSRELIIIQRLTPRIFSREQGCTVYGPLRQQRWK